jgi:hypothetical protein
VPPPVLKYKPLAGLLHIPGEPIKMDKLMKHLLEWLPLIFTAGTGSSYKKEKSLI